MGTMKACEGVIKAGDPAVAVGEVTGWNLDESANIKKYFKLGTCEEQSKAGAISRSLSIEGNLDFADAGQDELLIGETVELEVYPGGEDAGMEWYAITGVVETLNKSGSGDDMVKFSATIAVNAFATNTVAP